MNTRYDISKIMRDAHEIARNVRDKFETYKDALAYGLREAWKLAKGVITLDEPQKATEVPLRASEEDNWFEDMEKLIDERLGVAG
jgi:hypothetical protein